MYKLNQDGAVSFLTVIFLAIVLTIMTLSFVRISVNEQRQAVDDDLTTRAFYAAESGIEDGKRALAESLEDPSFVLNGDICAPAENVVPDTNGHVILSSDISAAYTCQFIEKAPGEFKATLDPWESITIPLNGSGVFDRVKISWHEPSFDDGGASWNRHTNTSLPTMAEWNISTNNYPAMLRATVFGANTSVGSTFSSSGVTSFTGFINPNTSAGVITAATMESQKIVNGQCDTSITGSVPACSITITSLPGNQKFLHLKSIYKGTNITVQLLNGTAGVNIVDTQAIIDVTGRAGDIYRRIEARVSLIPDTSQLPDVSIWSNEEICKNFTITDDPNDYDNDDCLWANP